MSPFARLFSPRTIAVTAAAVDVIYRIRGDYELTQFYQRQAALAADQTTEEQRNARAFVSPHLSADDAARLTVLEMPHQLSGTFSFSAHDFHVPGLRSHTNIIIPSSARQAQYMRHLAGGTSQPFETNAYLMDPPAMPAASPEELLRQINQFSLSHEMQHLRHRHASTNIATNGLITGTDVAITAQSLRAAFSWVCTAGRFTAGAFALVSMPIINHLAGYFLRDNNDGQAAARSFAARTVSSMFRRENERTADREAVQHILRTMTPDEARRTLRAAIFMCQTEFSNENSFFPTHPAPSERVRIIQAGLDELDAREQEQDRALSLS